MLGCGGIAVSPSSDSGINGDGASDASFSGDGWTQCSAPDGLKVCGGSGKCSFPEKVCNCVADSTGTHKDLSACLSNDTIGLLGPDPFWPCRYGCRDGAYCIADVTNDDCAPENLTRLYVMNGAGADKIRYADESDWTGKFLEVPPTCPSLPGVPLCGGACPPCKTGEACTGRSPLHPYSVCIPQPNAYCSRAKPACPGGMSCFTFKVQPDAQPIADKAGYCIPTAACQAAASSYPGGANCD